ncbi:MAG: polynucleotide adenylyltransferase PcnB [Gammaproteobacteria bacterium]|nr:polynucleotide adenylyltransferase PcnB [Gammaproteobacteria bacterium]
MSIKKLFHTLSGKNRTKSGKIIPAAQYTINHHDIPQHVMDVLSRLKNAGYQAYIVGGGVRDLLLAKHPKDFDVSTDAEPEEVKQLFRNCRLIGRRFRLAHIYFRSRIIEVSTFRAPPESRSSQRQYSKEGMILRDNVYGSIEQDAQRRDFTINALYYDAIDRVLLDFTSGFDDLRKGLLRIIGKASVRYREDPVRMLRAIRFAAKLDMTINPTTQAPIFRLGQLLEHIAPSRRFDELLKLLHGGSATKTLPLLHKYNLLQYLLPFTNEVLSDDQPQMHQLLTLAAQDTDQRLKQKKTVAIPFLFAFLLWPTVTEQQTRLMQKNDMKPAQALRHACHEVLLEQTKVTNIPKFLRRAIYDIWMLQPHLEQRRSGRTKQIINRHRFRAALDLLILRGRAGNKKLLTVAKWWRNQSSERNQRAKTKVDSAEDKPATE